MNRSGALKIVARASLLALGVAAPAGAQVPAQTYLDLQAGVGYGSNPSLREDGTGSGFARVSAYGYHGWGSERSNSSLSAYVENNSYFKRYGNRQAFALNATHSTAVSETLRLFGDFGVSGDFAAQLSSRFFGAPADTLPAEPIIPDSVAVVTNPDLAALSTRQYRLGGSGGANVVLSPRDVLTFRAGAERVFLNDSASGLSDYNSYDFTLAFQRQLNERIRVGVRGIATLADYSLGRSIVSYGPQVTADVQLDEALTFTGALGFVRTEQDFGPIVGKDGSYDLAFDGSLCRRLQYDNFCANASRRTQTIAVGSSPVSTSVGASYSRRLNATDQIQASLSYVTTSAVREVGLGRRSFYSVAGSYDRKLNRRLSAGVSLAARKVTGNGENIKDDLGGSLFIRHRFGDVR